MSCLLIVQVFCVVLCFCGLFVFVLCLVSTMLPVSLWIVHSWLPLRFSLMFILYNMYVFGCMLLL